jgi:Rieske Fe-S protein
MPTIPPLASTVTRRTVLAGAAVATAAATAGLAAGCGSSEDQSPPSGSGGGGSTTVAKADVPVGGGTVLTQAQVVVTQPVAGQFKAFSAVCTHQGCLVARVENSQILCPCHNSVFSAADGSNVSGPALTALAPRTVTVEGDQLKIS